MLTPTQASHVQRVYPGCRTALADFLARGVAVFVGRQNECGADVPAFAIRVVEQPDFWIDCAESAEAATKLAKALGLKVVWSSTS